MTTTHNAPEVRLADAPPIPGLRFRPLDMERDVAGLAELIGESNIVDLVDYLPTAENLGHDLAHRARFDPARDVLLAEIGERLVGAIQITGKVRAGVVVNYLEGWVRPAERRRGIGRALLHWGENRAREIRDAWAGDEGHAVAAWPDDTQVGLIALLEAEGYGIVRYGFMMVRPLAEPISDAELPAGLEVRPVVEADHRRIWDADIEAFRDHWEAAERTEEDYEAWFTAPELDTSLWRVAWDGDEVAGSILTAIWPEENERLGVRRGWLEHISVRRPWRRRGLASALIADSLRLLRERGLEEAALGVDAENTTGALRVYEAMGFRRHRTGVSYRKAI